MPALLGFTITIFVLEGEMDGLRTVEKSNWSGQGLVCPRALFRGARRRPEFQKPAVYILTGPSNDGVLPKIYVGQGDPVKPRFESHATKKDFWTTLVVFCAKDNNLNKAHLEYLESRLIDLAHDAQRAELDNANKPELPTFSEAESAVAEGFLQQMLLCLPLIGVLAFERTLAPKTQSIHLKLRGKGITADGSDTGRGFVVERGSQAVAVPVRSMQ